MSTSAPSLHPTFPHDPALEPVPAAKAEMARMMAQAAPVAAAVPAPQQARPRPVIAPAKPEDWAKEVLLQFPLVVDGVLVDRLVMRRITAKQLTDIIMIDDNEESINRRARAAIAGIDPDLFDHLEADDAVAVAEALRPFLPRALQGAETLELEFLAKVNPDEDAG